MSAGRRVEGVAACVWQPAGALPVTVESAPKCVRTYVLSFICQNRKEKRVKYELRERERESEHRKVSVEVP